MLTLDYNGGGGVFAIRMSSPTRWLDRRRIASQGRRAKKLIVLKGWGFYEVDAGEAFRQVIQPTLAWAGNICRRVYEAKL